MRIITIKKSGNPILQIKKQIKKILKHTNFDGYSKQPINQQKIIKTELSQALNRQSLDSVIQSKHSKQHEILPDVFEQFKILNHTLLEYCFVEQYLPEMKRILQKDILSKYASVADCINKVTEKEFLEEGLKVFFDSLNKVNQIVQNKYDEIVELCRKGHKDTLKSVQQMLNILSSVNSFLGKKLKHVKFSLNQKLECTFEFIIQSNLRRISLMLDDFVYFKEIQQVLLLENRNQSLRIEYYQYYEQKLLESKQAKILPCIIEKSKKKDISNQQLLEQNEKRFQQNQNLQSKNLQVNRSNNMQIKFSGNQQNTFYLTGNQVNKVQNKVNLQHFSALYLQMQQQDHENQGKQQMETFEDKDNKLKQSFNTNMNSSTISTNFNQIKEFEPQIFTKSQNLKLQTDFDELQQEQQEKINEVTITQNQQGQTYCKKLNTLDSTTKQKDLKIGDKNYQLQQNPPSKQLKIVNPQVINLNNLLDNEKVDCQEKDHLINLDKSSKPKSTISKKYSLQESIKTKKIDENTSNLIQTVQKENDNINFQKNHSSVEEEIQNISFEEKLFKQNEENNKKILLEFQKHQREKILQKQLKIITQFKKFRQLKKIEEKKCQQEQIEEDISEFQEEFTDSCFKVGGVLFSLQTQFVGKIHTVSINELVFFNSCNHMSISCDMKAYITKLNNFFLLDEFTKVKENSQQVDEQKILKDNLIEKIDFGEESISQVSFITSKSLLIFLNNNNQLVVCKYSEQEQQITLEQIIKNQQYLAIDCWSYLSTLDIIVTDGHNKLLFWQYKLKDKDFCQSEENFHNIVQENPVYTIDHILSDTDLCFYEEKSILFQAGFKSINSYLVKINDETSKITHQFLQTLNCQTLGHINSIQIVKRNQFLHFLLSLHCKNKIILWNIHHLTQQYVYSISLSDQINQIIFNPKINSFFVLIDNNFSSDVVILDQNLQNVNFPKNHQQLKSQNCKITKLSLSPEMNKLSIGYENGFLQFVEIINPSR
ncbi:hypothetical protein TTHERM_00052210 (macronuclear) [Tetrahymena thermophila SB210]|uniref:Uncharacterized protein n=1 Tax=Tetrahymena thermophila (strain SB210) TaxID=312017 RepID=Q23CW9_TETTS|nr:hypothetical protein TTHERM_00052210 [Tetrahymena thermophila SB210]EAR94599.3 hypothetical protein TTHERM_00052210 [Tetrahymena thermophila SB210]|eukprot:XP_001014917.3 hypothetical protein TTHERM_00052210 [Tetrahymena thermophila SB210]